MWKELKYQSMRMNSGIRNLQIRIPAPSLPRPCCVPYSGGHQRKRILLLLSSRASIIKRENWGGAIILLPPSLNKSISTVLLSENFINLTEFIEENTNVYETISAIFKISVIRYTINYTFILCLFNLIVDL
jgi:hypothetical protein